MNGGVESGWSEEELGMVMMIMVWVGGIGVSDNDNILNKIH